MVDVLYPVAVNVDHPGDEDLHVQYIIYVQLMSYSFSTKTFILLLSRRVHITEATLKHLNKAYEVEEGNGHTRDPYLKELNVNTYLVIDPRVSSDVPQKRKNIFHNIIIKYPVKFPTHISVTLFHLICVSVCEHW